MKKLLSVFLVILCLMAPAASAQEFDLSSMTPSELQELIAAAQKQLQMSEPVLIENAVQALKAMWRGVYGQPSVSKHGYLEIIHTQVTYINEAYASGELTEKSGGSMFRNLYCVIDFVLLSDYYGTAPYYTDIGMYTSVLVYRDGKIENASRSPFELYRSRTYSADFSAIISSVHDCGTEYNAVFYLLDEE